MSDNPELTDAEIADLRPNGEGLPAEMAAAFKSLGGRPKSKVKAVPVSLRVPPDVLAAFLGTAIALSIITRMLMRRDFLIALRCAHVARFGASRRAWTLYRPSHRKVLIGALSRWCLGGVGLGVLRIDHACAPSDAQGRVGL
ncbi:BrnA antitoxin family protein [Methylobacterium sp. J-026]|uniref:BrnA antitoxin family protein n=1 Tax=Methylobacterium sp. J-026 TaxID=2836624 RepID=UPI001FB9EAB4|nr:BrnA antitoxin family protein [Methylobacterium sp. J-026]MCJ2133404.1 BrnA antitoxin family protein [Methylobacterium sp. J-026]